MPQFFQQYGILIVLVVAMVFMMIFQSRSAKKRQAEVRSFYDSLKPGTEVITIGGVIGKVVSVDTKYEEIVIDSEGSLLRFSFRAVSKEYIRPAFISDEEAENAEKDQAKDKAKELANESDSDKSAETFEENKTSESSKVEDNKDDNKE